MKDKLVRVFVVAHCHCLIDEQLCPESSEFNEEMFINMAYANGKVYDDISKFQKDLNMAHICSNNFFVYFKPVKEVK